MNTVNWKKYANYDSLMYLSILITMNLFTSLFLLPLLISVLLLLYKHQVKKHGIAIGVKQGGVLSPILFGPYYLLCQFD